MARKKQLTSFVELQEVPKQRFPGKMTKVGMFYPDQLTLVRDKAHYLYDLRVEWPFDEDIVKGIMEHGLMGIVECVKVHHGDGVSLLVFDGRQGVINSIEANNRLEALGQPKLQVKVNIYEGNEADIISKSIIKNNHRRQDTDDPVLCGFKARQALDRGVPIEKLCEHFRVVAETVHNWLKLNELCPDVQKLVSVGELTQSKALRLRNLPLDKQHAAALEMIAKSARRTDRGREHLGVDKRRVKRLHELGAVKKSPVVAKIFEWLVGDVSDDEISDLIDFSVLEKAAAAKKPKAESSKKREKKPKGEPTSALDRLLYDDNDDDEFDDEPDEDHDQDFDEEDFD